MQKGWWIILLGCLLHLTSPATAEPMKAEDAQQAWKTAEANIRRQIEGIETIRARYHAEFWLRDSHRYYDCDFALKGGLMLRSDDFEGHSYFKMTSHAEDRPVDFDQTMTVGPDGAGRMRQAYPSNIVELDPPKRIACSLPHGGADYGTISLPLGPDPVLQLIAAEKLESDLIRFDFRSTITNVVTEFYCVPSQKHMPRRYDLFMTDEDRAAGLVQVRVDTEYAAVETGQGDEAETFFYPVITQRYHNQNGNLMPYSKHWVDADTLEINSDLPEGLFTVKLNLGDGLLARDPHTRMPTMVITPTNASGTGGWRPGRLPFSTECAAPASPSVTP